MQGAKSETTRELLSPQTGIITAIQVVMDEIVLIVFFNDSNQFSWLG